MKKLLYLLPFLLWVSYIFILSNQSFEEQTINPKLREWFSEQQAQDLVPDVTVRYGEIQIEAKSRPYEFMEFVFRKSAHILGYAFGALCVFLALSPFKLGTRAHYTLPVLIIALLAGLDEWNQSTMASRTGAIEDVFIDVLGAIVAMASLYLLNRVLRIRNPQA